MSNQCATPRFRMGFPKLMTPENDLQGRSMYSVTALIPKDADLTVVKAACKAAIVAKWGEDEAKWPKDLKLPFGDGNTKGKVGADGVFKPYNGYADTIVLNLKRKAEQGPPTVVGPNPHNVITDPNEVYAGRWAKAYISFYAYDKAGNRGVGVGLNHIQLLEHDEMLGGVPQAADIFADESGEKKEAVPSAAKSFLS